MWEMKRNVSVVCVKFRCIILISGKIIKEMPGSVASGTLCTIFNTKLLHGVFICKFLLPHVSALALGHLQGTHQILPPPHTHKL